MQALAKIAVRSGEPYRLQCYSILAAAGAAGAGGDPLGLQPVTRPTLALLDRVYAAQVGGTGFVCVGACVCERGDERVPLACSRPPHPPLLTHTLDTHTPLTPAHSQAVLDELWALHGDDVEGWPEDVVASLARRSRALVLQVGVGGCERVGGGGGGGGWMDGRR